MIEWVLKQEQVRHSISLLKVLESVHKALKPLVEFTDEDYVTVSYVSRVLHLFHSSILTIQEDGTAPSPSKFPSWIT